MLQASLYGKWGDMYRTVLLSNRHHSKPPISTTSFFTLQVANGTLGGCELVLAGVGVGWMMGIRFGHGAAKRRLSYETRDRNIVNNNDLEAESTLPRQ
jgi:hypothetical protein